MVDKMHHEIDARTKEVTVRAWTQQDHEKHLELTRLHEQHLSTVQARDAARTDVLKKVATAAGVSIDELRAALGLYQSVDMKDRTTA